MRASLSLFGVYLALSQVAFGLTIRSDLVADGDDVDILDAPLYNAAHVDSTATTTKGHRSGAVKRSFFGRSVAPAPAVGNRLPCSSNADCLAKGYPPLPQKPKSRHAPLRARQSACSPVQNQGVIVINLAGSAPRYLRYQADASIGTLGSTTVQATSLVRLLLQFLACSTDPWTDLNFNVVSSQQQTQNGANQAYPYLGMVASRNNTGSISTLSTGSSNAILLTEATNAMSPGPAINNPNLHEFRSGIQSPNFLPFEGAVWSIDKTAPVTDSRGKVNYPLYLTWYNPDGTSSRPPLYLSVDLLFATPDLAAWRAAGNGPSITPPSATLTWQTL